MADLTVDPSQVQSISVDPSEVTAAPAQAAAPAPKGMLDTAADYYQKMADQPITDHTSATMAGVGTVGQGIVQGVQGLINTVRHPIDTAKGLAAVPSQAAQVPGAIKDINASADPAGTYAKVAGQTAGQAGGQALVAAATPTAAKVITKPVGAAIRAVSNLRDIPAALSADTVETLNKVAAKEGLPPTTATTARDAAAEMSQNFINRAKATYKVVDDAVGGDLKPVQEKIQDLNKSIRVNKNMNPELADKQTAQLAEQQNTLQGLVEKAKAAGVTDADRIMTAADKDYSKGMAMKKVQSGVATASGQAKMGGHPHPGGFASQIDRLERTGVLQRALGQDATDAMVENAKTGLSRTRTVGTAKTVAKVAVGGALAGKAIDVLSGKDH